MKRSNHDVTRLSDGRWLKVARDASPEARRAIETDADVNEALGRPVLRCTYDGRTSFVMDHLGDVPDRLSSAHLEALARLHDVDIDVDLPNADDLLDIVHQRIEARVEDARVASDLRRRLIGLDVSTLSGHHLVHTDPHRGNWVDGLDGPLLIDFESAIFAAPGLDFAALAHSAVIEGDVELAHQAHARSGSAFETAFVLKYVSAASWLYRDTQRRDEDADAAVAQRLRLIESWNARRTSRP